MRQTELRRGPRAMAFVRCEIVATGIRLVHKSTGATMSVRKSANRRMQRKGSVRRARFSFHPIHLFEKEWRAPVVVRIVSEVEVWAPIREDILP